jgi:hypothetical protein
MAYTVNLTHRGPQVIECIDLFDEARYGADKLFFRGRFKTTEELKCQVAIALGDTTNLVLPEGKTKEDYGIGNPLLEGDDVPTIALNRHYIPNKKFWNNVVPDVEEPYRASAAVKFSIRVHFRDDFAYIDFGCPWEFVDNGRLNTSSDAKTFTENFVLLQCHFISKEDALQILDGMFSNTSANTAAYAIMRNAPQIVIETTELVDEDGSIISL